jgi:RecA-family ATPase
MVDHEAPEALGMRISPILQERMPTLIFGEGDSLKSFLATFLCVITRTGAPQAGLTPEPGNVLYLDWEEDADTFWHRLDMLTTGMNIAIPEGIYWRHMVEPLTAEAPAINKLVREKGIDLVVVDSFIATVGSSRRL